MGLVTRYFSTAAAGAGDGTTWADRAALFDGSGNWSSIVTGFDFTSDALETRIGPGNYSCGQTLAAALFAHPPTAVCQLALWGCDSSGTRLVPPYGWTSDQPAWNGSSLPVIATTANIATISQAGTNVRMLGFTASGRTGGSVISVGHVLDWCQLTNSSNNTNAIGVSGVYRVLNSVMTHAANQYSQILQVSATNSAENVRLVGSVGTAGVRAGIYIAGFGGTERAAYGITSIGNGGPGIYFGAPTGASTELHISRSVSAGNATGVLGVNTAGQTNFLHLIGCAITGNTGWGIDAQSGSPIVVNNCRLRDNDSGNITGMLANFPSDVDIYTTDSDDATEYANAAGGDYRIKSGLPWSDRGIGVSQMAAAAGGRRMRGRYIGI